MRLPEALEECADLLMLAASTLKRTVASHGPSDELGIATKLNKVLELASQLQQIVENLDSVAGVQSKRPN